VDLYESKVIVIAVLCSQHYALILALVAVLCVCVCVCFYFGRTT
jgi:hypothetical protein